MISIYYCSPVRFLEKIQATWVKRRFHMHQSQKVFFLPLEITPVKSSSSHVDCAPEYLKCNGNFILSLIGSKGYHVTCSHESQPTTNKKYGGGVVESIKWSLRKNSTIVWHSLQCISGRRKTWYGCCRWGKDQQWVRWVVYEMQSKNRLWSYNLKYCCNGDFNFKSESSLLNQ